MNLPSSDNTALKPAHKQNVIPFPTNKDNNLANRPQGWWCNLSEHYQLRCEHEYVLSIRNNGYSQYSLLMKLLTVNTCEVIFYDCELTSQQQQALNFKLQSSDTRLINAKESMYNENQLAFNF